MNFQTKAIKKKAENADYNNVKKPVVNTVKKTDWKKLIKSIFVLLEPEIRKAPAYYKLIPLVIIAFEIYGIVEFVKFSLKLIIK